MQTADNIYESHAPHILTPHTEISPPHRGAPTWAIIIRVPRSPFSNSRSDKKKRLPAGQSHIIRELYNKS